MSGPSRWCEDFATVHWLETAPALPKYYAEGDVRSVPRPPRACRTGVRRMRVIRNDEPNSAFAAVAPKQTITSGCTRLNSATSHGQQATISVRLGVS